MAKGFFSRGFLGRRREVAEADPTLMVTHTLTRSQPPDWTGYRQRIDRAMLAEVAWPLSEQPLAFVCGPTSLVESVASMPKNIASA